MIGTDGQKASMIYSTMMRMKKEGWMAHVARTVARLRTSSQALLKKTILWVRKGRV